MNYLQIVTKLANLSDVPYSSIADTESLTGEIAILGDWAKSACFDIQNKHDGQWKFLHSEYIRQTRPSNLLDASAATDETSGITGIPITAHGFNAGDSVRIHGTTNYDGTHTATTGTTANLLTITATYVAETFDGTEQAQVRDYEFYIVDGVKDYNKDSFYYYLKSEGANKSTHLRYQEYRDFKRRYFDYEDTGAPQVITVTPDKKLRVYPAPDDTYVIGSDAYDKPVELIANADAPPFATEFHDLVVYKALTDYAGFEESSSIWLWASARYEEMYKELEWQQIDDGESKTVVAV